MLDVTARLYSPAWRRAVRRGVTSSADALVPILIDRHHPASVVDVGAGEGWFCEAFRHAGVGEVVGVDGPWADPKHVTIRVDFDTPPYPELGRFDLAVSLETAEHVAPEAADALVGWLCELAPVVVFSAAVPGQGGPGHVNEAWPDYWAEKFGRHGFGCVDDLRWELHDDQRIAFWYRQNILTFRADIEPAVIPRRYEHPEMLEWTGREPTL